MFYFLYYSYKKNAFNRKFYAMEIIFVSGLTYFTSKTSSGKFNFVHMYFNLFIKHGICVLNISQCY